MLGVVSDQCQLRTEDWFSNKKNYENEGDPRAVFNVLDSFLKENLDRLKMMRLASIYAKLWCLYVMDGIVG